MTKSKRALKPIPVFKTEEEEREFWATHDSTEYVDWSQARVVQFPNLRPSTTAMSVRLPDTLLTELLANGARAVWSWRTSAAYAYTARRACSARCG